MSRKLSVAFYDRDTTTVARELVGQFLCRRLSDGSILKTVITETEAYLGLEDRACHSYGGRRTSRTEVMWGNPGRAYVYFIYGMYFCLNVVTRETGVPEAVLIRGALPIVTSASRKDWMKIEPDFKKWNRIMSGPGKLCKILKIDKSLNGISLKSAELWIESGVKVSIKEIEKSPRVGIDYTMNDPAGSHQWPLRFLWRPDLGLHQQKGSTYENLFRYYKNSGKNPSRQNAKVRERSSGRNLSQT
jgi:DNA-3-methyladenine glycosylase